MATCSHRESCKREGKITHACVMCDFQVSVCQFHRHQGHKKVQRHITEAHPVEYTAATAAAPSAIAPGNRIG